MQQIGERADLLGAFFCQRQTFREGPAVSVSERALVLPQEAQVHDQCSQTLRGTFVQRPGQTPLLIILQMEEPPGEFPQGLFCPLAIRDGPDDIV